MAQAAPPGAEGHFDGTGTCVDSCPLSVVAGAPTNSVVLSNGKVLVTTGDVTQLYDPGTGAWVRGSSCPGCGQGATVTFLDPELGGCGASCGKVLAVGGQDPSASPPSRTTAAFLYDPIQDTWGPTEPMSTPRAAHTATLLPTGDVLVTGGCNHACNEGGDPTGSAELYRAGSGEWTPVGDMTAARYVHSATLLQSGKVLVAGGIGVNVERLFSAELYDPATGTWSRTGSLAGGRWLHSATLLQSGQVLVAGGRGGGSAGLNTGEIYDPATAGWSGPSLMASPRRGHTATLLPNGKVLVAGGLLPDASEDVAELYDPAENAWNPAGPTTATRRFGHSATLLPVGPLSTCGADCGKVLLAGGCCDESGGNLATAELYTPRPVVTSITPSSGSAAGGTPVTVSGTGLASVTEVRFGDVKATSVSPDPVHPDARLVAVAPPHPVGTAELSASTPGGVSASGASTRFTFTEAAPASPGGPAPVPPADESPPATTAVTTPSVASSAGVGSAPGVPEPRSLRAESGPASGGREGGRPTGGRLSLTGAPITALVVAGGVQVVLGALLLGLAGIRRKQR